MKTFRMFGMALVAAVIAFAMSSCEKDGKDDYKDYPQLIVGKWFCFTPESSIFMNYQADGSFYEVGYGAKNGWREYVGTYEINGNKVYVSGKATPDVKEIVELTNDRFVIKTYYSEVKTNYRVKESFDIKGNYSYLNSVARVVPAAGKTALQLPEGVTFNGQNSISIDAMHGERIIEAMKKFFADATFTADGKLNHKMDGETKNYTHNGNNLTFDLYEGGSYKVSPSPPSPNPSQHQSLFQ